MQVRVVQCSGEGKAAMSFQSEIRHYVVLKATPELRENYNLKMKEWIGQRYIAPELGDPRLAKCFKVVALPSNDVDRFEGEREDTDAPQQLEELVVAVAIESPEAAEEFESASRRRQNFFIGSGADLPFSGVDHWCPREASDPMFGNRADAERLLEVAALRAEGNLTGEGVNVVIVDQGLDKKVLADRFGGGWRVGAKKPGETASPRDTRPTHAMMVAHNILRVAPQVKFFDLPMVPERITDVDRFFLNTANAAYRRMVNYLKWRKARNEAEPWIVVNAWAIFDRSSEHPRGSYTDGPDHPFNKLVAEAADLGVDIVFSAGNCGQFCPDMRCGALDQGPGQSVFGANCHPKVLSVGAVRADTMWLGYSSQGPGQPNFWPLGHDKPDLCAASQFCDTDCAYTTNGGSSAACALASGVIAALRTRPKWNPDVVSPEEMREILNKFARKTDGPSWNNRTGNGILNAAKALSELARRYP